MENNINETNQRHKNFENVRDQLLPEHHHTIDPARHEKILEVRKRLLPVSFTKIEKEVDIVVEEHQKLGYGLTVDYEIEQKTTDNDVPIVAEHQKLGYGLPVDYEIEPNVPPDEELSAADKFIQQSMKNIFEAMDLDNKGEIDRDCLGRAFQTLEMGLKKDEVDAVMSDIDINNDGSIELDEFEEWFLQQDPVAILVETQYNNFIKRRKEISKTIFVAIDLDKQGEIDRDCLGRAFKSVLDMGLKKDEVDAVMSDIDINNDGSIELDEFEEWFLQQDPVAILVETQFNSFIKSIRLEMSKNIFAAIDFSNTGTVNRKSLGKAFKAFKMGLTEDEIDAVMIELLNGTTESLLLNEAQFRTWFLKQSKIALLLQEKVEKIFHNDPVEEERRKKVMAKQNEIPPAVVESTSNSSPEKPISNNDNNNNNINNSKDENNVKQSISNNSSSNTTTSSTTTTTTTTTANNSRRNNNNKNNKKESKIPILKGSRGRSTSSGSSSNSTTSPMRRQKKQGQRGHLSVEKIEANRKAAERRNIQYRQRKRAEQQREKEIARRKKKAIADALKRVDHLPEKDANSKYSRKNDNNSNSVKKNRTRKQRGKRKALLSYNNNNYANNRGRNNRGNDDDIPGRTVFKKKSVHAIHMDSTPVTFFVRDNEQLSIDSIEGYGQLSMSVMDQQGQTIVQNGMVFDSKAFFYLNGGPAKISGDPIYPGQFRYDFFMRESVDTLTNDEKDEAPLLSVSFTLFSEFFQEEEIDPSSSLRLSSERMRGGWSTQTRMLNPIKNNRSGYRVNNNKNDNNSNISNNRKNDDGTTTNLLSMGRNGAVSNTTYRAESVSRGIESTRHNSMLTDNGEDDSMYVSPNSRPKTIGHVDDAIDSLLTFNV